MNTTREVITQVLEDHMKHSVVIRTEQLIEALVSALQQREQELRESCAKIAETHSATDCDGPDCGVVIAAAIRRDDTPQEGDR